MEVINRKAKFDYFIEDTFEAGLVLTGSEIKSIRLGMVNIKDSYCIVRNNECFILNMHITQYKEANLFNHEETRTRKLLLHKKEILKLSNSTKLDGTTIIPLKLYIVRGRAKVLIGLAKGKKNYDKRNSIKEKDIARTIKKELKEQYR